METGMFDHMKNRIDAPVRVNANVEPNFCGELY
jgi:hypothetical protein